MKSKPVDRSRRDAAGVQYVTPAGLVDRWGGAVSVGTLANWRSTGDGPPFVKLSAKTIVYPLADLERFERERAVGRVKCRKNSSGGPP